MLWSVEGEVVCGVSRVLSSVFCGMSTVLWSVESIVECRECCGVLSMFWSAECVV